METFWIPRGERVFRVGREEGSDLRLEHVSVSARHARIEVMGEAEVEVVDCESSNGTFVNGVRVERSRLAEGDLLSFAAAAFQVQAAPPAMVDLPGDEDRAMEEGGGTGTEADAEREALRSAFTEEREALAGKLASCEAEIGNLRVQLEKEVGERERYAAELLSLGERMSGVEEENRRLQRDLMEAEQRERRLQESLSETRREAVDREGVVAGLRYEMEVQEGRLRQAEEGRVRLQQACDEGERACAALRDSVAGLESELGKERGGRETAEGRVRDLLSRLSAFAERLLGDWRAWIPDESAEVPEGLDAEAVFERVESVAAKIRGELDRIEPIWHEFGEGVQEELSRRCGELRGMLAGLESDIGRRSGELAAIEADLAQFREWMDAEVRRAQGLSRKGVEVEIPERYEAMVIARDRELDVYRTLVERLEELDAMIERCGRSWRARAIRRDLRAFRESIAAVLETAGVKPFDVEKGLVLTPKHRPLVQVLSRKGWGTKPYSEHPFQPGEVTKVVRCGYRLGEGEASAVLRKVEVLIRGGDE